MLARLADVPRRAGADRVAARCAPATGRRSGSSPCAAYGGSVDDNGEHEAWHVADLTAALARTSTGAC